MFQALKTLPVLALCILQGCSSSEDCTFEKAQFTETGLKVEQSCSDLSVTLTPEVKVDDIWYPHWKHYDNVHDELDDGVVVITGEVDVHTVGVYYIFYDATDLHGNHAHHTRHMACVPPT